MKTSVTNGFERPANRSSLPSLYLCSFLLLLEGRDVYSQAFFLCDEGGQVQWEAVRVVQQPCGVT